MPTSVRTPRPTTARPYARQRVNRRRGRLKGRRGRRRIAVAIVVVSTLAGWIAWTQLYSSNKAVSSGCTVPSGAGKQAFRLSPEQAQNAAIIAAVALKMGLPDHAVTVALATSLQESKLTDLKYGDLDSVGLFQQRPSQGWGTRAQLLDPVYATTAFYHRLVQVAGWSTIPVTEAAQTVQLSAAPTAYEKWETEARALAIALTGEQPATFSCELQTFTGGVPNTSELDAAATHELGSPMLGVPLSLKTGWQVASWAVAHAWEYHIAAVTFGSWTWTAMTGSWQPGLAGNSASTVQVTYSK